MKRKILTYPDEKLRAVAKPVASEQIRSGAHKQLILDMIETMRTENGIGLAAPQVDCPTRIIVVNAQQGALALINPEITSRSWRKSVAEEGCLSLPGVNGPVKRSAAVRVRAISPAGKTLRFKAAGLFARVIQHEIDHLDGILFIDKAEKIIK